MVTSSLNSLSFSSNHPKEYGSSWKKYCFGLLLYCLVRVPNKRVESKFILFHPVSEGSMHSLFPQLNTQQLLEELLGLRKK